MECDPQLICGKIRVKGAGRMRNGVYKYKNEKGKRIYKKKRNYKIVWTKQKIFVLKYRSKKKIRDKKKGKGKYIYKWKTKYRGNIR